MSEKIRIKDIALKAGTSVGTVDRVLHNRPNVSQKAREKIEKVLSEMHYQPNVYASALAYNRSYTFYLLIPKHGEEAYWDEIEEGAMKNADVRHDFQIDLKILYYERLVPKSFSETCRDCLEQNPDGVIVVPNGLEPTRKFTDILQQRGVPFVMLDSYLPELKPLTFIGQDPMASGLFAAKMLMLIAPKEKDIAVMRMVKDGRVISKQQANRETGFRDYMRDNFPNVRIHSLDLPVDGTDKEFYPILERFFKQNPGIHHCITFSSNAYVVGKFLQRTNRRGIQIAGYDMISRNGECLSDGSASFIIAQHAYMQGYNCMDSLFRAIVLKKEVRSTSYMPIELLMKENMAYYRREQV